MGRAPCCDKADVKKGPWSPEEDATLKAYIEKHGTGGNWIALPQKIGLKRCGKSCRLRWLNYLRPNIKHGGFSEEEDNIICNLYISIGSRWSIIAAQLPGRTDNDIKNYWNTRLKKKLLGRRKHSCSSGANRGDQGLKDTTDDAALSSTAAERLQLHMKLQNLQNPFSFYNNPALWPKLHPFQEKMIQTVQCINDQNPSNPLMMMQQFAVSNDQTVQGSHFYHQNAGALEIQEQYAKLCIDPPSKMDHEALINNAMSSLSNRAISKAHHVEWQDVNSASFQAHGLDGINNSGNSTSYLQQDEQIINDFDFFKEMNNDSKESFMWWATENLDNKSVSSNSSDSTSVLQSQAGVFQDYELGYNM